MSLFELLGEILPRAILGAALMTAMMLAAYVFFVHLAARQTEQEKEPTEDHE